MSCKSKPPKFKSNARFRWSFVMFITSKNVSNRFVYLRHRTPKLCESSSKFKLGNCCPDKPVILVAIIVSHIQVKHRPLRIVLGWGTELVE